MRSHGKAVYSECPSRDQNRAFHHVSARRSALSLDPFVASQPSKTYSGGHKTTWALEKMTGVQPSVLQLTAGLGVQQGLSPAPHFLQSHGWGSDTTETIDTEHFKSNFVVFRFICWFSLSIKKNIVFRFICFLFLYNIKRHFLTFNLKMCYTIRPCHMLCRFSLIFFTAY